MSKNVSAHMRIYIYINIVGSHGQAGRTDQHFIFASCLNDEANARERLSLSGHKHMSKNVSAYMLFSCWGTFSHISFRTPLGQQIEMLDTAQQPFNAIL